MEEPGQKLRRARERARLRYRDVKESSQRLALLHDNAEYVINLSRLADIETKGTLPSLFRLYSLCAIYKLNFTTVLRWYGIHLDQLPGDAIAIANSASQMLDVEFPGTMQLSFPQTAAFDVQMEKTSFLSRQIAQWGSYPLALLHASGYEHGRYAVLGSTDWSMWPLVPPGSFLQVDESRKRIIQSDWANESERPIYLLESRNGFHCAWCRLVREALTLQYHPCSDRSPETYTFPGDIEVIGQIVGIAMRPNQVKESRKRF